MFQDKDQEELCAILFDQNNGNLDASIESVLNMQTTKDAEDTTAGSSLVEDLDKDNVPANVEVEEPKEPIDKKTQELIDEMLAEEQAALY